MDRLAVVDALMRDVEATLGAVNDVDLSGYVLTEAARVSQVVQSDDDFRQNLVGSVQQRIHDEFIDVCWPRCPCRPNHPLRFEGAHGDV